MRKLLIASTVLLALFLILWYLVSQRPETEQTIDKTYLNNMADFALKSSAFKNNETIPAKYTCDGENVNPLLEIKNPPAETKSFILIMDDPDATRGGTWDHWIMWNIDAKTQYVSEDSAPMGAVQGKTSFGYEKYGGPCPPKGSAPHHYNFKLYALNAKLNLPDGSSKADVERAMQGHVLAETVLIGLYARK